MPCASPEGEGGGPHSFAYIHTYIQYICICMNIETQHSSRRPSTNIPAAMVASHVMPPIMQELHMIWVSTCISRIGRLCYTVIHYGICRRRSFAGIATVAQPIAMFSSWGPHARTRLSPRQRSSYHDLAALIVTCRIST